MNSARDESGASAAEYALLVAGIAAVIVVVVVALGVMTGHLFSDTCDQVRAQVSASC